MAKSRDISMDEAFMANYKANKSGMIIEDTTYEDIDHFQKDIMNDISLGDLDDSTDEKLSRSSHKSTSKPERKMSTNYKLKSEERRIGR